MKAKRRTDDAQRLEAPILKPIPVMRPYRVVVYMKHEDKQRVELMHCHPTVFYSKLEMSLVAIGYTKQMAAEAYEKISEELVGD
jgi:hypothetical protein